jgi:hypothetical protein
MANLHETRPKSTLILLVGYLRPLLSLSPLSLPWLPMKATTLWSLRSLRRTSQHRPVRELYCGNSSGSFATLAAIRRASSRVRLAHWVTDLV